MKSNPDSGFIFAFGGAKSNNPAIWDTQEVSRIREVFYPRMNMKEEDLLKEEKEDEEANTSASKKTSKRQLRAANYKKLNKNKKFKK